MCQHLPDGAAADVQHPGQDHLRGDERRDHDPRQRAHQGPPAALRGEGQPEDLGEDPEVQGDRAKSQFPDQRLLHLRLPQDQDPAGQRQAGRGRAREERDQEEGGRGQEARDRGLHRQVGVNTS